MLNEPNCDSPANIDAGVQLRNDKEGYKKRVRTLVLKSMDDLC
jgi:ubiquitin-protein ligase